MMDRQKFREKYFGELTLRNGTHVKFLYPVTKEQVYTYAIEARQIYTTIQQHKDPKSKYRWVFFDDLSLVQFQIVFAGIKIYGNNYWQRLWDAKQKV